MKRLSKRQRCGLLGALLCFVCLCLVVYVRKTPIRVDISEHNLVVSGWQRGEINLSADLKWVLGPPNETVKISESGNVVGLEWDGFALECIEHDGKWWKNINFSFKPEHKLKSSGGYLFKPLTENELDRNRVIVFEGLRLSGDLTTQDFEVRRFKMQMNNTYGSREGKNFDCSACFSPDGYLERFELTRYKR